MMSWERECACHWLGFGVAMGAPELLRGSTGAQKLRCLLSPTLQSGCRQPMMCGSSGVLHDYFGRGHLVFGMLELCTLFTRPQEHTQCFLILIPALVCRHRNLDIANLQWAKTRTFLTHNGFSPSLDLLLDSRDGLSSHASHA
jgi:hypothetical protein